MGRRLYFLLLPQIVSGKYGLQPEMKLNHSRLLEYSVILMSNKNLAVVLLVFVFTQLVLAEDTHDNCWFHYPSFLI